MSETPRYQRLLAELKRRRVFRVIAVYGAAAFGVLQGVDILVDALALPATLTTAAALFVLAGFPVAVVLTWTYDRRGGSLVRTEAATADELAEIAGQPAGRRWPIGLAALAGVALLALGVGWTLGRSGGADEANRYNSIAVLPFASLTEHAEGDYFGDGLAEEVMSALSGIEGLQVAARTSAFQFRGRSADVREIGAELGVAVVLEGSVRRSEDRIRITAQLIDASTGFDVWSDTYDREAGDVLTLQEELAGAIVTALRPELDVDEVGRLADPGTRSVGAHDLYLLGLHHWNERTEPDIRQAIGYFERAIERDSAYAGAWAGLALAEAVLPTYSRVTMEEAIPLVRQAAARAIALDSTLPEPHAAIGYTRVAEWESELRRALALDGSYAQAHGWLGVYLHRDGRDEEGLEHVRRAYDLDPLAPITSFMYAEVLKNLGHTDEAEAVWLRFLERRPDRLHDHDGLIFTYLAAGRYDEAIEAVRTWATAGGRDWAPFEIIIEGIRDAERRDEAITLLDEKGLELPLRMQALATWYAWLGDRDGTLTWLERAAAPGPGREGRLSEWVIVRPEFAFVREDPRFQALVRGMR